MSDFNPDGGGNIPGPTTNVQPLCIINNEMLEGIVGQWCYEQGVRCEVGINWLYGADGNHTGLAVWDAARISR